MSKRNVRQTIWAAAAIGLLAALACAQSGGFRWDGPLSRVITPNGDGINDFAVFCFDNPSSDGVSGTIYTMLGREVANMQPAQSATGTSCPAGLFAGSEQFISWNPLIQGQVHSGVYVYQVRSEGRSFTGTIVVVR